MTDINAEINKGLQQREQNKKRKRKTKTKEQRELAYSKRVVRDIRSLLWIVTVGALVLAWICIQRSYLGSLPWITSLVALPWSAYTIVANRYLGMAESDHRYGITYKIAEANGFYAETDSIDSPPI